MAHITIKTMPEEQEYLLGVLRKLSGKTISVSAIATRAKMKPSRVRYVLMDLEEAGKIKRIPVKAYNARYIRYKYEVL